MITIKLTKSEAQRILDATKGIDSLHAEQSKEAADWLHINIKIEKALGIREG